MSKLIKVAIVAKMQYSIAVFNAVISGSQVDRRRMIAGNSQAPVGSPAGQSQCIAIID